MYFNPIGKKNWLWKSPFGSGKFQAALKERQDLKRILDMQTFEMKRRRGGREHARKGERETVREEVVKGEH